MTETPLVSCSSAPIWTPYHQTNLRGSKASLLKHFSSEGLSLRAGEQQSILGLPTRRGVLKAGVIATGGILGLSLRPQRARGDVVGAFLFFVGAAALTASIHWIVRRVLDNSFPQYDLGLRPAPKPIPSQNQFHNSFSEPWEVTNRRAWRQPKRLPEFGGYRFGLNEYLLESDMNGVELGQVQYEFEKGYYDSPMLSADIRRPYNPIYRDEFRVVRENYRGEELPDLSESDVLYVQTFRAGGKEKRGREHRGFGVARGGKAHLLLH